MENEQLVNAIQSAAIDNRLSCEAAHTLAQRLHVSLQEIGAICNSLQIKISRCQLGCF